MIGTVDYAGVLLLTRVKIIPTATFTQFGCGEGSGADWHSLVQVVKSVGANRALVTIFAIRVVAASLRNHVFFDTIKFPAKGSLPCRRTRL